MDGWGIEAGRLITAALGGRNLETGGGVAFACVGLLLFLLLVKFTGAGSGMTDCGWARRLLGFVVCLAAMLIAAIAASLYLSPLIHSDSVNRAVRIAAPVLGALVLGIPIQLPILRGHYGQVLFTYAASAVLTILVMMGLHAAIGSFHSGESEFSTIRDRKSAVDGVISR